MAIAKMSKPIPGKIVESDQVSCTGAADGMGAVPLAGDTEVALVLFPVAAATAWTSTAIAIAARVHIQFYTARTGHT